MDPKIFLNRKNAEEKRKGFRLLNLQNAAAILKTNKKLRHVFTVDLHFLTCCLSNNSLTAATMVVEAAYRIPTALTVLSRMSLCTFSVTNSTEEEKK